ncbi:MAG: hypothetical protein EAX96_19080 [Candidatus Lokiarchaeota archaeon]|nr:hypothetical protein [Candidatus Lokiarchaeota archaeon]
MPLNNYGDIGDDMPIKEFLLISKHVYKVFRKLGLYYLEDALPKFRTVQYDITKDRWDNMINTGKHLLQGKISEEESRKTFLYMIPHVITVRSDLQIGTNKLLYGDSTDVSFAIVNDYTNELLFIFNGHLESGVPHDWWIAGLNDDLMDRRHMKYGVKLREIPAKTKNLLKSAKWLEDVLLDVRNERTPYFSHSLYTVCMCYASAMFNVFAEQSCYETMGSVYDGLNAKNVYKLKEMHFLYHPVPPLISSIVYKERGDFLKMLCGLTTGHHMITNTIEDEAMEWVKTELSEVYPFVYLNQWTEDGIPTPAISIKSEIPNKKKDMIGIDGELVRKIPQGSRINTENMDIPIDETNKGYLFDIDHETSLDIKLHPGLKISSGMGLNAKFFK